MRFHTRKWIKPEDLNPNGTLFGGRLLEWIDEECALYSIVQLENPKTVTKYMSEIDFKSSAHQGDIIEIGIEVEKFGTASLSLKCEVRNIWCSKIASRLCRTYTQNHGLKDLVQEFCGKKIDKKLGSSTDWNKNLDELTDAQLQYCGNDVIYLHKIKDALHKMLVRENRLELYENCIQFLKTRIKLDQSGFTEDIFQH